MTPTTLKIYCIPIYDPTMLAHDGLYKKMKIALHVAPIKPKGYHDLLIA